jgi:hypothetical protein
VRILLELVRHGFFRFVRVWLLIALHPVQL